ncbi:MAG: hypothetical protein GC182_16380 [Rhodopseudomonas sp.]|nr:hypothetical protein [Rhodopseudomonas sp.]
MKVASMVATLWSELRGLRRALLTLALLFFVIMLLEVDLGHRPILARQDSWGALVPVVWLPISLLALMAVQVAPSWATSLFAQAVMAISAAVGMIGSGLHMMTSGVDPDHLARAFSSNVWGGPASPNWPVAIALASVLGFIAVTSAQRDGETLPDRALGATAIIADLLIVAGCGFAAVPSLVLPSAVCLVVAALLLLATLLALLINARTERAMP